MVQKGKLKLKCIMSEQELFPIMWSQLENSRNLGMKNLANFFGQMNKY